MGTGKSNPILTEQSSNEKDTTSYIVAENTWKDTSIFGPIRTSAFYRVPFFICISCIFSGITGNVLGMSKFNTFASPIPWVKAAFILSSIFAISNELGLSLCRQLGIESPGLFFLVASLNGRLGYSLFRHVLERRYLYTRQYATFLAKRSMGSLVVAYVLLEASLMWWKESLGHKRPKKRMREIIREAKRKSQIKSGIAKVIDKWDE